MWPLSLPPLWWDPSYICTPLASWDYRSTYHSQLSAEWGGASGSVNGCFNGSSWDGLGTLYLLCFAEMEWGEVQEERFASRYHGLASIWGDNWVSKTRAKLHDKPESKVSLYLRFGFLPRWMSKGISVSYPALVNRKLFFYFISEPSTFAFSASYCCLSSCGLWYKLFNLSSACSSYLAV